MEEQVEKIQRMLKVFVGRKDWANTCNMGPYTPPEQAPFSSVSTSSKEAQMFHITGNKVLLSLQGPYCISLNTYHLIIA